jgi:hypothetical protein
MNMAAATASNSRYKRWSIRVPRMLLFRVKDVAQKESWAVSDLLRMLIVLGAVVRWLGLRKQENLGRLESTVRLGGMMDMLEHAASHKRRSRA